MDNNKQKNSLALTTISFGENRTKNERQANLVDNSEGGCSEIINSGGKDGAPILKKAIAKQLGSTGNQSLNFCNKTSEELQEIIEGIPYPDQFSMTSISNSARSCLDSTPQRGKEDQEPDLSQKIKGRLNKRSGKRIGTQESEDGSGQDSSTFHWPKQNLMMTGNSINVFPQIFAPSLEMSNENSILKMTQTTEGKKMGLATFGGGQQRPIDSDESSYDFKLNQTQQQKLISGKDAGKFFGNSLNYKAFKQVPSNRIYEKSEEPSKDTSPRSVNANYISLRLNDVKSQRTSALDDLSNRQSRLLCLNNFHSNSNINSNSDLSSNLKIKEQPNIERSPSQIFTEQDNSMLHSQFEDPTQRSYEQYQGRQYNSNNIDIKTVIQEREHLILQVNQLIDQLKQMEQQKNQYASQQEDLAQHLKFLQEKHKDNTSLEKLRGRELETEKSNSKSLKQLVEQKNEKINSLFAEMSKLEIERQAYSVDFERIRCFAEEIQDTLEIERENTRGLKKKYEEEIQKTRQKYELQINNFQSQIKELSSNSKNKIGKNNNNKSVNSSQEDIKQLIIDNFQEYLNTSCNLQQIDIPKILEIIKSQYSNLKYENEAYLLASRQSNKQSIERASTMYRLRSENSKLKEEVMNISSSQNDKLNISNFSNSGMRFKSEGNSKYEKGTLSFLSKDDLPKERKQEQDQLQIQEETLKQEREKLQQQEIKISQEMQQLEKLKLTLKKQEDTSELQREQLQREIQDLLREKNSLEEDMKKQSEEMRDSIEFQSLKRQILAENNSLKSENSHLKQMASSSSNVILELEKKLSQMRQDRSVPKDDDQDKRFEKQQDSNRKQFQSLQSRLENHEKEIKLMKERFLKEKNQMKDQRDQLIQENQSQTSFINSLQNELSQLKIQTKNDIASIKITPEMLSHQETIDLVEEVLRKALRSSEMKKSLLSSNDILSLFFQLTQPEADKKQFSSTSRMLRSNSYFQPTSQQNNSPKNAQLFKTAFNKSRASSQLHTPPNSLPSTCQIQIPYFSENHSINQACFNRQNLSIMYRNLKTENCLSENISEQNNQNHQNYYHSINRSLPSHPNYHLTCNNNQKPPLTQINGFNHNLSVNQQSSPSQISELSTFKCLTATTPISSKRERKMHYLSLDQAMIQ